jgi:hypothetical protein
VPVPVSVEETLERRFKDSKSREMFWANEGN